MKEFKEMSFYTTADLAEKLKMNIQVIGRKLQSGEIEGYKIGKEWRVEEEAVQKWLEKISGQSKLSPREKVLGNFFRRGRLTHLPAQQRKKLYILEFFLEKFDSSRVYSEAEVNELITPYYEDFCTIRREFIMQKMMSRKDNRYRRNSSYRFLP